MADYNDMRAKFFQKQKDLIGSQQLGQQQAGEDAIKRRFAALGGMGGGAAIGATLQARRQAEEAGAQARGQLAGQELGSIEGDIQRQFGAGEAERQRMFGAGEAEKQRQFAGAESAAQRGLSQQAFQEQKRMFDIEQANKLRQLDLAQQQFELDKDVTAFNKRLAEIEAGRTPPGLLDSFGNLLGNRGGFLGSGVGDQVGAGLGGLGHTIATGGLSLIGGGGKLF